MSTQNSSVLDIPPRDATCDLVAFEMRAEGDAAEVIGASLASREVVKNFPEERQLFFGMNEFVFLRNYCNREI